MESYSIAELLKETKKNSNCVPINNGKTKRKAESKKKKWNTLVHV